MVKGKLRYDREPVLQTGLILGGTCEMALVPGPFTDRKGRRPF